MKETHAHVWRLRPEARVTAYESLEFGKLELTNGKEVTAGPGSYVLVDEVGPVAVVTKRHFERLFERDPEAESVPVPDYDPDASYSPRRDG